MSDSDRLDQLIELTGNISNAFTIALYKVNSENNQTTNEQYFAGGDAINGGAEVVNGAYDGKLAAQGIHQWLNQ